MWRKIFMEERKGRDVGIREKTGERLEHMGLDDGDQPCILFLHFFNFFPSILSLSKLSFSLLIGLNLEGFLFLFLFYKTNHFYWKGYLEI